MGARKLKYKIICQVGESIDLKTKAISDKAFLTDDALVVEGEIPLNIDFASTKAVEMFRLHNLGRMIKITGSYGTVLLSVVRFNLFGVFAVINFFKTERCLMR